MPPSKNFYSRFSKKPLDLRDYLALERTILANERTLISYTQNGMALLAGGATMLYAIPSGYAAIASGFLIALGIAVAIAGVVRFRRVKRRLDAASPAESADEAALEMSMAQEKEGVAKAPA